MNRLIGSLKHRIILVTKILICCAGVLSVISMSPNKGNNIATDDVIIEQYEEKEEAKIEQPKQKVYQEMESETLQVSFRSSEKNSLEVETEKRKNVVKSISEDKVKELKKQANTGMDVCSKINLTKEEFIYILNNFEKDQNDVLKENAELIWNLSEEFNINPMVVIGVMGIESGWGISNNAINNNNLFGISYSKDGQKMEKFASESECIEYFCRHLSENYLCKDSMFYTGTRIKDVNFYYNPKHGQDCNCFNNDGQFIGVVTCDFDYAWAKGVIDCMFSVYNNIQTN